MRVFFTAYLKADEKRAASPVARALAPARGMLGRVLYAAAFFLLSIYTMDFQPTDKVEGVGDDFVRGGQDQTPITQKRAVMRSVNR